MEKFEKYLDPKNDLLFKKVFGTHKNLCISLLNSLMKFDENSKIIEIEYDTNELLPEIPAFKDTIVDVRCKDETGRQFIIEMQMNWTKDFQQRVLLNASKAYIQPLKKGQEFNLLLPVYSLNLVNDTFDDDPEMADEYYHQFKIVNIKNTNKQIKGLEFVFVELPKYKPKSKDELDYFNLWLRFLTEIDRNSKEISADFLNNEVLREAVECVAESALTPEELEAYDKVEDAIRAKKALLRGAEEKGKIEGKIETAQNLKKMGLSTAQIAQATGLTEAEIKALRIL
ncbi:MAG: Rpn family recombination-promoting nuclease/putative transposase [Chitinivibrionia bacterium]|nr:Rpn family recombination-promoting nuclease/putative transposase [Chitinivibrionia bacterium]